MTWRAPCISHYTRENLLKNPSLNDLIGGVVSVTLGDDEARRRRVQKSVLVGPGRYWATPRRRHVFVPSCWR